MIFSNANNMNFDDQVIENNETSNSDNHFIKANKLTYDSKFDYYIYCYDFLNNDDYELLDDNFATFPITDEWNWNLELTNCFTDLDSDYDIEIGHNMCINNNSIQTFNQPLSNESDKNQAFEETLKVTLIDTESLQASSEFINYLFDDQSSNNYIEKEISTLRLLNTAASLLKCESSDLENFVSKFDDQFGKSPNDEFDENIDFDEIAADIEINDIFLSTSTPTEDFINNELNFKNGSNIAFIEENLNVNDFVSINSEKQGHLRYIGKVHFASGTFCGIELNEPVGKHDGKLQNVRYFQCEQLHGIFAPIEKVTLAISPSNIQTVKSFPDLESTFSFKPITEYEQGYNYGEHSELDSSLKNESPESLNSKVWSISPHQESSKFTCDLNKTFDLTKDNSIEMIQTTSRLNTESRLKTGLIKPVASSSITGLKSSTSSTSSMTSHSSSSSKQNSNIKSLQYQMKLNKVSTTNSSTPIKGLNKPIGLPEKKVGAVPLGNANMNVMQPKSIPSDSTLKYKSKLNPPSKLIKFAAASTTSRVPTQKQSTDSSLSQPQQQLVNNSSLKKQAVSIVSSNPTSSAPQPNNLFENKQTKPLHAIVADSTLKEEKKIGTPSEAAKKLKVANLKSNELSTRLQKLQTNSTISKLSIPNPSTHAPKTSSPNRSPIRKPADSLSKITKILKVPTTATKTSSIPSFGVTKTQLPVHNVKPTTMISSGNVKKAISSIKSVESSASSIRNKKPETSRNATSTPNKDKASLLSNVKHSSRSSSNTSSTSRSSSIISNRSSGNLVASKTKQVAKNQNQTSKPASSLNMYQPSISLLSKPMINSSTANGRKSLQPISNKIEIDNNKMNQTFDIGEDNFDENELQTYIHNSQDIKQLKTEADKNMQTEANKRRHSILSIENNFEIMSADHAQKTNLLDGFLEFEEIPEFLDDYLPDTNNSTMTMTTQKENNNNSILDVDSFNQLFDTSPSVNNLKWLNSKIEEEKAEFKKRKSSEMNSIETKPKTQETPSETDQKIIKGDCHLIINDIIDIVTEPNFESLKNECKLVLNEILGQIQSLDDSGKNSDAIKVQEITDKSVHKDDTHMETTNVGVQLKKALVTDEKLVEQNLDKTYPAEEIKTEMQAIEKSAKPTEIKKNSVVEKTRSLLVKSTAATQLTSKSSKPSVNSSNQNLPLSIPKVKRSVAPVEPNKLAASRTSFNQLDSSSSLTRVAETSTSRVTPRKIVSKTTLSNKPVKNGDIKQDENDINSMSDIESQSTNSALSSDDGSEKSVSVRKSTVLKSTTVKSTTKTIVPITSTSINKSSSSINSVKAGPEKEPCTPSTSKLISKTARATRLINLSTTKQKHNNNKENQQTAVPKSLGMSKMYRSRDGLAASNTSIMSEVSNISLNSKSSIPTSNIRHSSISSNASATSKANSLLIQKQPGSFAEPKQTPISQRFTSSTPAKNAQLLRNLNGTTSDHRKTSLQSDSKSSLIKRSGALQNSALAGHRNSESLSVNTTLPANGRTTSSVPTISPSIRAKNEINSKNNEIARLEALCESRTKELTVQKIQLRDTMISFDAIAVAFKYLANDLQGFEVTSLRKSLRLNKKKLEENIKTLKSEIDIKNDRLKSSQAQLEKLIVESSETKTNLENKLKSMKDQHEKECVIMQKETELMLDEIKTEKETTISRMNKMMESSRIENETLVSCLREQLKNKEIQNVELEIRIKECEETLAKDKDERIQRLLDIQHNLEKEIESLKAALDIKNCDLFDLRKKNNELTTKLDTLIDVEMKYKRYKQELENLNSIIHNKNEQERLAAENNRNLAMKVEIKNKENQRLSMQNEQLQFRLQSQPNLSLTNNNESFDLSNISMNDNSFFNKVHENDNMSAYYDHCASISSAKRSMTMKETKISNYSEVQTAVVKLRSKSFKAPLMAKHSYDSSLASEKKYSMSFHDNNRQFRPVSENFDFDLRDHEFNTDYEMTRSDILYEDNDTDTQNTNSLTDGCSNEKYSHSNSSSTSLLDSQSTEDQMTKSVPCMVLKRNHDDQMTSSESSNYNKDFLSEQNNVCDNFNSVGTSSNSMHDHSVVILD